MGEELPTGSRRNGSGLSEKKIVLFMCYLTISLHLFGIASVLLAMNDINVFDVFENNEPGCKVGEVDERGFRTIGCSEFTIDMSHIPDDGIVYSTDD